MIIWLHVKSMCDEISLTKETKTTFFCHWQLKLLLLMYPTQKVAFAQLLLW